jgi:anaerobic dimethyl sulfoxide reductase subunit B (iron-sulfur subunit)
MSATTTQYGFFFDQSRCTGCQNCALACKAKTGTNPGQVRLLRLYQWETGAFPNTRVHMLFAPCYHCENPVCVTAANGALIKEPKYGAVLIDPDKATSSDLKAAWEACPYGAISFDSDSPDSTAYKCDMCIDRLEGGLLPACVLACPTRALDFGKLIDMQAKYGTNSDLEEMPSSTTVKPAVVFKPMTPKKQLVPYDANAALQLMAKRGSLPDLYSSPSDVTTIPAGVIARDKLDMKTWGKELILRTSDDSL